jgi:hypothetical protein
VLDAGGLLTPRPRFFFPGIDPVPIGYEAGWAPGPFWKGAENLNPTEIRSPDRPARSELLYRVCYPGYYPIMLNDDDNDDDDDYMCIVLTYPSRTFGWNE